MLSSGAGNLNKLLILLSSMISNKLLLLCARIKAVRMDLRLLRRLIQGSKSNNRGQSAPNLCSLRT